MYSAKEVAKITGLTTATLRYYEKENLNGRSFFIK